MALGVLLAVLTAISNGASNVLQRKANVEQSSDSGLSVKLLWRLLHRPTWLAGFAAVLTSFVLQAAALRFARLSVVQPIIVVELPLTLIAASRVFRIPLRRREWLAVALMTAGLAGMVVGLGPGGGGGHSPSGTAWLIGSGACAGIIGGLVLAALRHHNEVRAALLGAGAGIGFGTTAAFTKATMMALSGGLGQLFLSWTTYAMAVSGVASMLLMQNALQAGRLLAAQPGITLLDPFAAILWGVLAFGEPTNTGPVLIAVGFGAVALALGGITLSRSPVLDESSGPPEGSPRPAAPSPVGAAS